MGSSRAERHPRHVPVDDPGRPRARAPRSSSGPSRRRRSSSSTTPAGSRAITRSSQATGITLLLRQRPVRTRHAAALLQLGVPAVGRTDRPPRSTARCTWCPSASSCRSSGCCSSWRPWSRARPTSRPGTDVTLLPVGQHRLSTAICYEVVYPDLIAGSCGAEGSQLLTTITNDAWYGRSSAPYQHFRQAAMRAVEQGRYLVASANTGISGIVDPYGRVVVQSPHLRPDAPSWRARCDTSTAARSTAGRATPSPRPASCSRSPRGLRGPARARLGLRGIIGRDSGR